MPCVREVGPMRAAKNYSVLVVLMFSIAMAQESYDQLARHWDYDKNAPLNIRQAGVRDQGGIKIYDISYAAPVGDRGQAVGPNGCVVTAYLVVPAGKGPFPAIVYGHWCMPGSDKKNRKEFLDEAIALAQSGAVSLLPDHVIVHPGFVEDNTPLNEKQIAVEVQQEVNLRRGVDLLVARNDVDPKRIAYAGHSCDATAGGFLSGIEKRFRAFVIMAGGLSDEVDKKTKAYEDYRNKVGPEKLDAFEAKYPWMDPGKYVAHSGPAMMFLQYATDEPFLNGDLARQYLDVVGGPKKLKVYQAPH